MEDGTWLRYKNAASTFRGACAYVYFLAFVHDKEYMCVEVPDNFKVELGLCFKISMSSWQTKFVFMI